MAAGHTAAEVRMEREVKVGVHLRFWFYLVWDPMVPPQSVCLQKLLRDMLRGLSWMILDPVELITAISHPRWEGRFMLYLVICTSPAPPRSSSQ